ncbi:WcbI family polysaccharide biosynthesis putative acetyltransferase [uncultured Psychromonas sp.]|uniref:WcbI family polysaccharide biosynthesis putative acetyltransferase n=1 Tax=uncultured Psychromonas sp. TaxID=173974 RepID=UPI00262A7326|nr:WcbI family polysaccharide biosynthesis putative acetyltransferase [uncultured Psychromonas sp.]
MKLENIEINKIRDAAIKLIDSDPFLAFKLFDLALKYRPMGPLLIDKYTLLKDQLDITTFIIIGNCQSDVIADLIPLKNNKFYVIECIKAHEYTYDDSIIHRLDRTDYIITQPISKLFKGINTEELNKRYSSKMVVIPGVFFKGNHPDWFYPPKLPNGKRPQSATGPYHNQTIFEAFNEGLSEEEALKRYLDVDFNQQKYINVAEDSILELRNREIKVDIKMSDIILNNFNDGVCDFHTINHPKLSLMNELVNKLLKHIKLNIQNLDTKGEALDWIKLRTNPINKLINPNSIVVKDKEMSSLFFVKRSYEIYNKNASYFMKYNKIK